MAANRFYRFQASAVRDFHAVASAKWKRQTGKIGDISERGWGCAAVAKMHMTDPGAAQIFFQLTKNESIRRNICSFGSSGLTFHGTLR